MRVLEAAPEKDRKLRLGIVAGDARISTEVWGSNPNQLLSAVQWDAFIMSESREKAARKAVRIRSSTCAS